MHNNNGEKRGKNPQSVRRKPNYHTKYGKNCHKILSVYSVFSSRRRGRNFLCHMYNIYVTYMENKY